MKKEKTGIRKEQKSTAGKKEKSGFVSDFIFIFVLTVFVLLTLIMLGTRIFGYQMLTVDSGSMEPNLPEDSLIFVTTVDPSKLQADDVITFTIDEDGTLVTHRIVAVRNNDRSFVTKGDANESCDSPVPWENVVGKVTLCFPKIGGVFRFITAEKNRVYVYITIGILAGLTVLWIFTDRRKKKQQRKAANAISKEESNLTEEPGKPDHQ